MTKRTRIVDNSCLLWQYKWNTTFTAINHQMHLTDQILMTTLTFSSVTIKVAIIERLFWQLGTCFSGRCRYGEVAVVGRWLLAEVRL